MLKEDHPTWKSYPWRDKWPSTRWRVRLNACRRPTGDARGARHARRLHAVFGYRSGNGFSGAEPEIFRYHRRLHSLRRMRIGMSARKLQVDRFGSIYRRRLRILLCLHPELSAESHQVQEEWFRSVACTRRGESGCPLPQRTHLADGHQTIKQSVLNTGPAC